MRVSRIRRGRHTDGWNEADLFNKFQNRNSLEMQVPRIEEEGSLYNAYRREKRS